MTMAKRTEKADDDVVCRAGCHGGACDVDHNHHNVLSSACVFVGAMRMMIMVMRYRDSMECVTRTSWM